MLEDSVRVEESCLLAIWFMTSKELAFLNEHELASERLLPITTADVPDALNVVKDIMY